MSSASPAVPGPDASSEWSARAAAWRPRVNPWLIALSVMLATILEVLDTSVANVALPNIAGSLSATASEATWVLTSYLVANAIILPMTAWFGSIFGRKRFLLACIVLFTLASAACGLATSLGMLVVARIIQGAGGGALQPLSQAILMESFPPRQRGAAMALFGMGVVVAPIIGPTLGGYITDSFSWRWIFMINLPIGAAALAMVQRFVEDPPYIRRAPAAARAGVDYIGFAFMAIGLATMQILLDRGQEDDWFSAVWVRWFTVIMVVSLVAFVIWELRVAHPVVDLRVLRNRNLAVGTAMIAMVGIVLYGTIALLPLFLQQLMGYPALDSGLVLSPRGIGAVIAMILVGRLIARVDNRLLIIFGFALLTVTALMFARINLSIAMHTVIVPNILMGFAMGFVFVPLATVALSDLPNEQMGAGTGLFNLLRNVGGGVGIALMTTMLARRAQVHQVYLAAHITAYDAPTRHFLAMLRGALTPISGQSLAAGQANVLLGRALQSQAELSAYVDDFMLLAGLSLICVPMAMLFSRPRHTGRAAGAH